MKFLISIVFIALGLIGVIVGSIFGSSTCVAASIIVVMIAACFGIVIWYTKDIQNYTQATNYTDVTQVSNYEKIYQYQP
jgi:hypothetical protein